MTDRRQIKVWDPLVRLFHWSLPVLFTIAFISEDDFLGPHVWAGYGITGLLVIRLFWGLVGGRYARFSNFLYAPAEIFHFLSDTLKFRARRYLGHNPAGGAMVVALMVMLGITAISGMAVYAAAEQAGPLAGWLGGSGERAAETFEELHEFCANFTLLLIFIHLAGVLVESLLHRENLVRAMITGYKRAPAKHPETEKTS